MDINFEGKKVLVTGAAGFIGSHLTDSLLAKGADVIGLDNYFNGLENNLINAKKNPHFKLIVGDVRDGSYLIELTKNIDIIFHEAAFISVQQSKFMPELCNDINVNGTVNILNAARINNVNRVIFASSAALYGDDPELPKHERMYPQSLTPYGASKLAAESYMMTYYECYGLKTTALRYFNVYGPKQRNTAYAGAMALFIEGIIKYNQEPTIFGDGTQTRDFIYVNDVVKANLLAAFHENAVGQVFNVATGKPIDLNNLTKLILKFTHADHMKINYAPVRKGDILHSRADISKIKLKLGFEPDYTIEKGLKEYIAFIKTMS